MQGYFVANCVPICQSIWDTQFKLLHNIVYTEERLQRMGLSLNKGDNKITELRTIFQRESQNA